jgi:hypothetical protein
MWRYWIAFALGLALCGCGSSHKPPPLIAVSRAPAEIAALRILVYNATHEAAREAGETTVNSYTIEVRANVQRALVRAGYTVVVQPTDPFDLLARVHLGGISILRFEYPTAATMTLTTPEGRVVEQVSALVELDDQHDMTMSGPVALVEKMSRSPRVGQYAHGHERLPCEMGGANGKSGPVIAVPAVEPTPVQ